MGRFVLFGLTIVASSDCLSVVNMERPTAVQDIGEAEPDFDPSKRFVRITGIHNNSLIKFDFSIGEPELYIELVLPFQAFQDFCAHNQVAHLTPEEAARVDFDRMKWRYGQPGVDQ